MNNLVLRAISGAVYVAVIVLAVLCGQVWLSLLVAVMALLGTAEFLKLSGNRTSLPVKAFTMVLTVALAFSGCYNVQSVILLCVYPFLRCCLTLADRNDTALRDTATDMLCFLYIGLGLGTLGNIYSLAGRDFVLLMFVLIWLNDTGAYLTGSRFGRTRLCERLSPKKSWEGFWGGMLFCIVAGGVAGHYGMGPARNILAGALFGVAVSVFSTMGDLFESALKRHAGVKDSGNIIPGHGGLLDRVDSLLFVAPASLLFTLLVCYI
ncbi:MAG: phosphatidate cytidylyltransferase [Muribaculaceae bacterium]|nr:phosphatidate cytidylyltransferase [Muribaculaceae bacterium]